MRRAGVWLVMALGLGACGARGTVIVIDGSSSVYPITEAVAEEYRRESPIAVTIGISGTGGGFKKLCAGEVTLIGASRRVTLSEESACAAAGIGLLELRVALDGMVIVANPANDWLSSIDVPTLARIWRPEAQGQLLRWSQVDPGFPDRELHLFGPGVDSGTYDAFTRAVVGKAHASRGDFTSSEDDNVLVQGVATDPGALGFFGFAYYAENRARLKVVPVAPEPGAAPVVPTVETIADGTYRPLSRPLFLYASRVSLPREEVQAFLRYYLDHAGDLAEEVGYVRLPSAEYALARAALGAPP